MGSEGALAQLCAVEAELARRWRTGEVVPGALLNAYRLLASEFFDLPASQIGRGAPAPTQNRWTQHAVRNR